MGAAKCLVVREYFALEKACYRGALLIISEIWNKHIRKDTDYLPNFRNICSEKIYKTISWLLTCQLLKNKKSRKSWLYCKCKEDKWHPLSMFAILTKLNNKLVAN